MALKETYVRARIDTSTKARAEDALAAMGLSVSDAIRLLMLRVADEQRLPFDVKVPNARTRKAMADLEVGKGRKVANIKALPLLGELPVLGALFRSTDFLADRSELVFIITPRLVKPFTGEAPLPTDAYIEPSRKELFIDGRLEGRQPPADEGFQVKPESK